LSLFHSTSAFARITTGAVEAKAVWEEFRGFVEIPKPYSLMKIGVGAHVGFLVDARY